MVGLTVQALLEAKPGTEEQFEVMHPVANVPSATLTELVHNNLKAFLMSV